VINKTLHGFRACASGLAALLGERGAAECAAQL